ncbi:hypothetical protein PISMIDRAFT_100983 [Pisolithus microcarpus 441]|uniref:ATP-dependent DNA helicase n=1 Tax=Pisolithus microcarpus 441 TaxID=765257 RepID=A0A0C9ZB34_9AGAM|nr:DNA helicase Pif1 like protein [Pisolithus microcarpus]KIK23159.1 hypothetical protein PISMIDRAFT_100983 [Pisolithus microcarpus 441]
MFRIPITDDNTNMVSSISLHSTHADLSHEATLIIWDELPMVNKAAWECVHMLCCDIMHQHDLPFGGKPIIGCGDFHPVAPVIAGSGKMATLAASVKSSQL